MLQLEFATAGRALRLDVGEPVHKSPGLRQRSSPKISTSEPTHKSDAPARDGFGAGGLLRAVVATLVIFVLGGVAGATWATRDGADGAV